MKNINKQEADILKSILLDGYKSQKYLSETSKHSIGVVNKSIKSLIDKGYLDSEIHLTKKSRQSFENNAPQKAIILAAGFGMRMVPINTERPKALIEVNEEPLIERIIIQLHEVGINEIYVVVGFMKECFEYLIDEYGVLLIVNEQYAAKNNLHSLYLAKEHLDNAYIIPCDIWCDSNPFNRNELYSWYMVSDLVEDDSNVRVNRKMEIVKVNESVGGNSMVGIAYLTREKSSIVKQRLMKFDKDLHYNNSFWEEVLYDKDRMIVNAKIVHSSEVVEINTYEQLRELDEHSDNLKTDAIQIIEKTFNVNKNEIADITVLKKGMTNRSFLFTCKNDKYIMRIPGEGTEQLINRTEEAEVYEVLKDKDICDDIAYINSQNGYKITRYLSNSRVCDSNDKDDLQKCMKKLREFHMLNLKVSHEFDIFKQIDFYESLWGGAPSVYKDYRTTKENVLLLKSYIDKYAGIKCLTHIDAVPDNFLFSEEGDIRLIDWEYAGMQDPHVDIAMFCIYSLYDKTQVDQLIDIYFENNCPKEIRLKIYCYIAVCGLLWSNWCEYKRSLGIEFGEYSIRQYRYAKDFYKLVKGEI